jgi:polysaccharide chain length determinant protein (PEP-CTERM system associated)
MDEILEFLRSALPGMWRHRWSGLLAAIVTGVVGAAVAILIPSKYEATARVDVDTQTILKPLMVGLTIQPNVDQQVGMMARTLINRPNIDRVMAMSGIDAETASAAERDALLDRLIRDIKFVSTGTANFYSISYRSPTPESAYKVVQSLLDIFVESNIGDKRRDTEQARRFIDEQIESYEKRLQAAEAALRDFKIRNLSSMPGNQQDYVASAREARTELEMARAELRQAEGARDALKREVALEQPISALADFTTDAEPGRFTDTDSRLQDSRKRLDELLMNYTEAHPDVVNMRLMMRQLEEQKRAELQAAAQRKPSARPATSGSRDTAYNVIRASLAASEAQVASLKARVSTAQAKVAATIRAAQTVPQVEADLVQLNRDYEINKTNYEQLLARRESAQIADDMDSSAGGAAFRVVDPPRVAPNPVWPNRLLLLAMTLVASLAAGLGCTVLLERTRPTYFTTSSLREATELPILGVVSMIRDASAQRRRRLGVAAFSLSATLYICSFAAGVLYVSSKQLLL